MRQMRRSSEPQLKMKSTGKLDVPANMTEEGPVPQGSARTRTPMENNGIWGDRMLGPGDRRTTDPKNSL
jgi:hypothetical protein